MFISGKYFVNQVFTCFNLCEMLAEILGFCEVDVILFLLIKLVMLLLFVVIFVVVVLMVTMVTFWCPQSSWLCVCVCWPSEVVVMMLFLVL